MLSQYRVWLTSLFLTAHVKVSYMASSAGETEKKLWGSLAGQGQNPGGSLASQFSPAGKLQATEGPASKEVTPRIVLWLPCVYTYMHTYQAGALRLSCFTYEEIEVQGPNDLAQGQC